MSAVEIRLEDVRFYMRNVHTRMPFKYGAAVLTAVPILHVIARGALKNGTPVQGVAADILPPKWFDKDPAKSYEDNVADLLWAARAARSAYLDAARSPASFFAIWQDGYAQTVSAGDAHGLNRLTAVHGSTLIERALIDAVGCGVGASYFELLKANLLGLDLGAIHPELQGVEPGQVIGGCAAGAVARAAHGGIGRSDYPKRYCARGALGRRIAAIAGRLRRAPRVDVL